VDRYKSGGERITENEYFYIRSGNYHPFFPYGHGKKAALAHPSTMAHVDLSPKGARLRTADVFPEEEKGEFAGRTFDWIKCYLVVALGNLYLLYLRIRNRNIGS